MSLLVPVVFQKVSSSLKCIFLNVSPSSKRDTQSVSELQRTRGPNLLSLSRHSCTFPKATWKTSFVQNMYVSVKSAQYYLNKQRLFHVTVMLCMLALNQPV